MTTRIICVVNNTAKEGSGLRSEHGLSFWIETEQGVVLFDTGQTAEVLAHNLDTLGLQPENISHLVLSHAHYDHTGGLEAVLSKNAGLTLHAHTDIFRPRFGSKSGEYRSMGLAIEQSDLERRAKLSLSSTPTEIVLNLWTTGDIADRPEPGGFSANHFVQDGEGWQPDPYRDDMSLVLKTGQGLVLICGCCHAGILNTLFHVARTFEGPVTTVIGGTHLGSASDAYLNHVIDTFNERFPNMDLYLNHCTSDNAMKKLSAAFGSRVSACHAGTVLNF